ncbi:hypothetical protein [Actinopolymorpha cephalotaxi]|uniref:Uncharacterized protein n=1 Tax=Actinopolymorpha cephalotaxi TaxID=504797 RepID=A0ABX2SA12_9ACTN|nr:hypothetical protein [Actinopolymorpha cephalotaxi]NYH85021.1 hypothetical protein [Actinopolymorpha cephalotaxi]
MGYPAVELGHDPKLDAGLGRLSDNATGARLADLTDFEWDIVYVFGEGDPADEINHAAGMKIVRRGRFVEDSVCLFIFKLDGKVVRHLRAPQIVHPGMGDRDVRVEPARTSPKPVSLELVYPDR